MKLYIFKSETKRGLRGFASDPSGDQLPSGVGPWSAIGVVPANANPPHGLERSTIEKAIEESGYQLWRMKATATPTA
jgi:hypothetical protein